MTIAPPRVRFSGTNKLTVRLIGRNPVSRAQEFTADLPIEEGLVIYDSKRPYESDDLLDLSIAVNFRSDRWLEASARIGGFRRVTLQMMSSNAMDVHIDHSHKATQNCDLVCFENGQTGTGPCLTCPDGEYSIRICC